MVDALLGTWKLTSQENFDELMKKMGVGLMTRKVANAAKPNIRFRKLGDEWVFETISSIKTHVIKFKMNEEFHEETIDGRKVHTTFSVDGDKLVQVQKDKDNKVVCTIVRSVLPNGELRVLATADDVVSTRIYRRDE